MQIGADSNLNSPTNFVRTLGQLPFRASALSTVVRRRVSTSEHASQVRLSIATCEVCMSSALVDQVLCRYYMSCSLLSWLENARNLF